MAETKDAHTTGFKWGKVKAVGGKKRDVKFYESFTYDGVEYSLYDSVYVYGESEPEPYIGKLIKIWENPDKTKKMKILWFFRPNEISNYWGTESFRPNELLLASGEGRGLANINPLDSVAGKCNVVCTSKDSRNPQPSAKEIQMADFIFYRTFDVEHQKILCTIDEKIAGIDVKFLLNRVYSVKFASLLNLNSDKKEVESTMRLASNLDVQSREVVKADDSQASISGEKAGCNDKGILESKQRHFTREQSANNTGEMPKSDTQEISSKHESKVGKDIDNQVEQKGKSTKNVCGLDERPSKKAKFDGFAKVLDDSRRKNMQNLHDDSALGGRKAVVEAAIASEDKSNLILLKDSHGTDSDLSKKKKPDEEFLKLANMKFPEESPGQASTGASNTGYQMLQVTKRPEDVKSKWSKLPWEDRMQDAHERGKLVLLQNLDPSYSSAEVEDIIWHAFGEASTAKMIQRTAFSSPHSGQAFVIFKSKAAAEKVVLELDEGCLLLSNGRPLVGSIATPSFQDREKIFYGHLVIDKLRAQMGREKRAAVSTSHCSQPNTVEYDMAMEWCLLQERSDRAWKNLYEEHGNALSKLKATLKAKESK